ncbi:hypothetical protein [Reichenbachiella sp.]|uniref:hypothetical protein n=1 Tax=Reichenbachiella sp. TaxID=2184521 RepID=UPI003BAFB6A7
MEKLYIDIDQEKIDKTINVHNCVVSSTNRLLQALKTSYHDKLGFAFNFEWLRIFLNLYTFIDSSRFFDYIWETASNSNEKWKAHAEELGVLINKQSFPIRPLNQRCQDSIAELNDLLTRDQVKIEYSYLEMDVDGNCSFKLEEMSEYLKDLHSTVLSDEKEIQLYKKGEAAALVLQSLMADVIELTPEEELPYDLEAYKPLKFIDLQALFDIDKRSGEVKVSGRIIPRLMSYFTQSLAYNRKELRSTQEQRNSDLNPGPDVNFLDIIHQDQLQRMTK